jgi:hypothetical protein
MIMMIDLRYSFCLVGRLRVFSLLILMSVLTLAIGGCGGGGGDTTADGSGVITGTGIVGRAATGAAIANATITIKSLSGVTVTTTTGNDGGFSSPEIKEATADTPRGPYLLRTVQGNGRYLYSVAHAENAQTIDSDSKEITINIHPFTDLIIRNWFAIQGLNIDNAFDGNTITSLPSATEIKAIGSEFLGILGEAMNANSAANVDDLLASPFVIGDEFDRFLDNTTVIINNQINITLNQVFGADSVQTTLVSKVDLDHDFTDITDNPPTIPQNPRALAASENEVVVVWEPSSDDKGVAGYHVYRDGTLITTTPFPVYVDDALNSGVSYSYTVEAVDGRQQTSGQSATPATIMLDAPDTAPPSMASSVQVSEANGSLSLGWAISDIGDVAGFRIYRGASGSVNTSSKALAVITSSAFQDFDVAAGTTYCYRIITFDASGNVSEPTPESCGTTSGTSSPSTVGFSSASYSVGESQSSIVITVERSGDITEAISVDYSITALSASADVDFTQTSGTLNWSASDSSAKTFTVQVVHDNEAESDETVQLSLLSPSANTSLGANDSVTLTIVDTPQVTCIDLNPTDITTDTLLSEPCYNVTSDVSVTNNATLTIDPGVRLVFAAGTRLSTESDGLLLAVGTQAEPIIFTGAMQAPGYWDGIYIDSIATSMVDYSTVEYAGGTTSASTANVVLTGGGHLSMDNSTLRHSGGYGFTASNLSGTEIGSFTANVITLNENAPLYIPTDLIGDLDANNSFTGNITANGGDNDYIQVVGLISGSVDITRDQTWHNYSIDYHMPSGHTEIGAALTLSPGITLVFPADAMLEIETAGTLNAVGTSSEPITFTGQQQSPGYWNGIQFTFNHTDNTIEHAVVEYGGGGGNIDANVGVFGGEGMLTLRNTTLRQSEHYGFFFDREITLAMENVTSTENNYPGIINFDSLDLLDSNSDYTGNSDDRIRVSSPIVDRTTSMTIPDVGIPYFLSNTGNTDVDMVLTIEPGVELQFNAGGGLNVSNTGAIVAQGTTAEPITFSGALETKGYWNGIQVTFSSIPTVFDNTILEYGGAPSGNTYALIGYYGAETNGSVTNSILRSSQNHGIWLYSSTTGDFTTGNTFEDIDADNVYRAP